jgi:DNA-binding SARP family transcriptional activator/WD40 repeat protein
MDWELRVLGPLELFNGGRLVRLGGAAAWVLGRLAVDPGRVVSLPDLMSGVWGDDLPGGPEKAIRSYVSRLRSAVGPDLVVTQRPGYKLAIEPDRIDAVRFARLVASGRSAAEAGAHVAAVRRLDRAEQDWRGDPYADLPDMPYVRRERTRLSELRVAAREHAIGAQLAGEFEAEPVVAELEALLAAYPLREQLWAHLVIAHYRAGRQAEALASYQRARSVLIRDLGIDPGRLLREAERRVLRQEPADKPMIPAELAIHNGAPFVGRDAALSTLTDLLDEAAFGTPQGVLVRAGRGTGKTRLLTELARVAIARGATVRYSRGSGVLARSDGYTVYVLDDADRLTEAEAQELARRWRELRSGPVVVVATAASPVALGLPELELAPLTSVDITSLVRLYAPHEPAEDVAEFASALADVEVAAVHERAAAWAVDRAVAQVGTGVATLTIPADEARQARAQVLAGVSDLARLRRASSPSSDRCPYPGLGRFEADDAAYFHGRDRAIAELLARVAATEPGGMVTVIGPSGSGKSSLVRAGLLAALADGALPGSADWQVQVHEPSRSMPDGAADLIVIDQFEEVFTVLDPAARSAYAEALHTTARLVITLRSDYLTAVSDDPGVSAVAAGSPVLMARPSSAELADMVRGPAGAAGLAVEPGLVEDIVADLGDQRHLPLLCTALAGLWRARTDDTLTRTALQEQGGVAGAVERLGEQAYAVMDAEQQAAAHRMLVRLTDLDPEVGPIRRPEQRRDLLAVGGDGAAKALAVLVAHGLVVADGDRIEITHEALLRHWPRLSNWLHADAAGRQLRRNMIHAAEQWHRGGHEPGDLYRGARLAAAREWAAGHDTELTPAEHEFLSTSITYAERGQRRLRLLTGTVAAGLVLALIASILAAVQWRRADDQRANADTAATTADVGRLTALALTERDVRVSMLEAVAAARLDSSTTTSYGLLAALQRTPGLVSARGNEDGDPQRAMALSADGSLLAVGSRAGRIEVYANQRLLRTWTADVLKEASAIRGMQFLPGDKDLAVWSDDKVQIFDPHTGVANGPVRAKPRGITAGVLSDGHTMVLAGVDEFLYGEQQPLRLWDITAQQALPNLAAAGAWTSVSSDLTLAGPAGVATIDNGRLHVLHAQPSTVAARSRDDRTVAAASGVTLTVWEPPPNATTRQVTAASSIVDVAFSADGHRIITGGDQQVSVWDTATLSPLFTATIPDGGISRVALSPDGRHAYGTGTDGGIYTWLIDDPLSFGTPLASAGQLPPAGCDNWYPIAAPLPGAVAIACDNVSLVDYANGAVSTSPLPNQPMAFAADENQLVADFPDGTVVQLIPQNRLLATADVPIGPIAVQGNLLVLAAGDQVRVLRDGRQLMQIPLEVDPSGAPIDPGALAISPDGRFLALSLVGKVQVMEISHGRVVATFAEPYASVLSALRFSADGSQLLLAGSRDQLVDTRTWRLIWDAAGGHAGFTVSLAFGADGQTVLSGGTDGRVLVLDRRSGAVLAGFGPGGSVAVTAYAHGSDVIVVENFAAIRSFRLDRTAWIERACAIAGRDMTAEEWARLMPGRPRIEVCPPPV